MGRRGLFLVGGVSLVAVWVSVGLLLTLWGIGFTVGTMPGRIDPEYLRLVNRQANLALVLMVAVHGLYSVFFASTVRWGHWLARFGGAFAGSLLLVVLVGYLVLDGWPVGWLKPMMSVLGSLINALARTWDSA
jgi:hypothetical protein